MTNLPDLAEIRKSIRLEAVGLPMQHILELAFGHVQNILAVRR